MSMDDPITQRQAGDVLANIQEGMKVYGRDGDSVGKVDMVFMGAMADSTTGVEPITAAGSDPTDDNSVMGDFAEIFDPDGRIPDVMRRRMRRNGFIRIKTGGLLGGRCYALREQIASVSDDKVTLTVSGDGLIK